MSKFVLFKQFLVVFLQPNIISPRTLRKTQLHGSISALSLRLPSAASCIDRWRCSALAGLESKYKVSCHELNSSKDINTTLRPWSLHKIVGSISQITFSISPSKFWMAWWVVIASIVFFKESDFVNGFDVQVIHLLSRAKASDST
jgi:hypothetical protein